MSLRQIFGLLLAGPVFLISDSPVVAQNIGDVTVIPEGNITPADAVSLDVWLTSGGCCIELSQPTQVEIIGNEVFVDIFAFVNIGPTIFDALLETVPLGTFGRGTYFYEVTENGPLSQSQVSGSFQVVPEPSTVALIAVAIPLLLFQLRARNGRRRNSGKRWAGPSLSLGAASLELFRCPTRARRI